jgi:Fur family ferric uptake transcriptional regulator
MAAYITKQRRILLTFLEDHPDESLSAADIAKALADQSISVSAVYRNLAALEEEGRIRRVSRGGGREAYYQYTDTEACRTHLHLLCKTCGATYHMDKTDADQLIRILAEHEKFAVDTVDTVLYGTCEACQIRERMRAKHEKE